MAGIRKIEKSDCKALFHYLSNPNISKYSRLKPNSEEEMEIMFGSLIVQENEEQLIPRVIIDIENNPIGMIVLWDYCPFRREGFLATWVGEEFWGKGYNQVAKSLFFEELFTLHYLENIYLLIRSSNKRSLAASQKFPYITKLDSEKEKELREFYFDKIAKDHIILEICKENYMKLLLGEEISG